MKKIFTLFSLLALAFVMPQSVMAQAWSYDFEDFTKLVGTGNKKKVVETELNGLMWHMCGVASSVDGDDFVIDNCSMKLYGEQDCGYKAPAETTNFTLMEKHSIGTLSFQMGPNQLWAGSENNQVAWIVQFSTDGTSWTTVGEPFKAWADPITVEREINHPAALVRIIREDYLTFDFTKGAGYSYVCNVDNIAMTEFAGTEAPELTASVNSLDFGEVEKGSEVTKSFTLTHKGFSTPVEVSVQGSDAAAYTIKDVDLSKDGTDEITITFKPFKKGEYTAVFVAKAGVLTLNVDLKAVGKTVEGVKFTGGTGTEEDPYLISCKEDLLELSDDVEKKFDPYEGKYFLMTNDIDMSDAAGFRPIGNNFSGDVNPDDPICPFSGIFDGGNHKIYNLNMVWEDYGFIGVFGIIDSAVIKNLTVSKSYIYGDFAAAAIVGTAMYDCVISNCHTTDDVVVNNRKFYAAGICAGTLVSGNIGTVIEDCTNAATVLSITGYAAGVLSTNSQVGTQILRCGNYGEITDNNLHVGGICAGTKTSITISDCYNMGNIQRLTLEGAENALGSGILADASETMEDDQISISNCYNLGSFNVIGEIMHPIYSETMALCFNTHLENNYFSSEINSFDFENITDVKLADMKTQAFVDMLNNGRKGPWQIVEGVNDGYPVPTASTEDTGIDNVSMDVENNGIYSIYGVKLDKPMRGINIINGKKVMVR